MSLLIPILAAISFADIQSVIVGGEAVRSVAINGEEVWQAAAPLPYDYRIEYLESKVSDRNKPYIDTQVPVVSPLRSVIRFSITKFTLNAQILSYYHSGYRCMLLMQSNSSQRFAYGYGSSFNLKSAVGRRE